MRGFFPYGITFFLFFFWGCWNEATALRQVASEFLGRNPAFHSPPEVSAFSVTTPLGFFGLFPIFFSARPSLVGFRLVPSLWSGLAAGGCRGSPAPPARGLFLRGKGSFVILPLKVSLFPGFFFDLLVSRLLFWAVVFSGTFYTTRTVFP